MKSPRASSPRPIVVDLRSLAIAGGVALTVALLWQLRALLPVLFFTGLLTLVGAPFVRFLKERFRVPRGVGAGLAVLSALGVLGGIAALVAPQLVEQLTLLVQRIPQLFARLESALAGGIADAAPEGGRFSDLLADELSAWFAGDGAGAAVQSGATGALAWSVRAVGAAGRSLLVPVLAFFLLTDLPRLTGFLRDICPDTWRPRAERLASELNEALGHMLRGQLFVALLMAILYSVGLTLSGVPLSLAIGVIAGLAYFIPFASGTVALSLSLVFLLLEPDSLSWGPVLGTVATAAVVQALEAWVLTPRIIGGQVGLPPAAVVVAVLVGGTLAGFTGVLLSLPVATVIAAVYQSERRVRAADDEARASVVRDDDEARAA